VIAVIFEVWPADEQGYLELANTLRWELDQIDGFISVERFRSVSDASKLVSLSFWRDEVAVAQWRTRGTHRDAQARGRDGVLRDYRMRIAAVSRDYGMTERAEAPTDSRPTKVA